MATSLPSLKDQVGITSQTYSEEITQNRLTSFCQAIGSQVRVDDAAPPTFLTLFRKGEFELLKQIGFDLSQVLHSEQEYQLENSIHTGDQIIFETRLAQVIEKRRPPLKLNFLFFENQPCGKIDLNHSDPRERKIVMELQTKSPIPFFSFSPITREQLRAYAEASGDFNPIHLDEEVAKKAGLPGIIAHGMLIASLMSERALSFVEKEAQLPTMKIVQFQTRFKAMTLVGDTPSIGGTVKEWNQNTLVLDLQAKNQRGEITTLGSARFVVSSSH
jgi:acyl dehydratase